MKKHILFYKNSKGEVTDVKAGDRDELRKEALPLTVENTTDNTGAFIIDSNKFDSFLTLAKKTEKLKKPKGKANKVD